MKPENIPETALYQPVKKYLQNLGYTVNGEVKGCDLAASREDELLVVELKVQLNIRLLAQAIDRQKIADIVYVAVPRPPRGLNNSDWQGKLQLLKRLGLGLITVAINSPVKTVDVIIEPVSSVHLAEISLPKRKNLRKRSQVVSEIGRRTGDYNQGGSVRKKIMTAYREKAIKLACILEFATVSLKDLRLLMEDPKIENMLRLNPYNWYERCGRGVYRISEEGRALLTSPPDEFKDLIEAYRVMFHEFFNID